MFTQCPSILNNMFDTLGNDKTEDGNASMLNDFAAMCRKQDRAVLTQRLLNLMAQHCTVDLSPLFASPSATVATKNCHDDTAAMKKTSGLSCIQVARQSNCGLIARKLLPDLCTCSCPANHASSRRNLFGTSTNKCPLSTFDKKLKLVNTHNTHTHTEANAPDVCWAKEGQRGKCSARHAPGRGRLSVDLQQQQQQQQRMLCASALKRSSARVKDAVGSTHARGWMDGWTGVQRKVTGRAC